MNAVVLDRHHHSHTVSLGMQLEALMVACDLRGMATVRNRGYSGYLLRAVKTLLRHRTRVAIVSGFPVNNGFETDGPAGAIALAQGLRQLGSSVALLGVDEYISAMARSEPHLPATCFVPISKARSAVQLREFVTEFRPTLLIFIEVPGQCTDGLYRNMRFENISDRTLPWEPLLDMVDCPSVAFADGGNELGMGRIRHQLKGLPIACARTETDELVIADVSNWGVYGALALASVCVGQPLLQGFSVGKCLEALVQQGMVDGVTGARTPTEDGLAQNRSRSLLNGLVGMVDPLLQLPTTQTVHAYPSCVEGEPAVSLSSLVPA
ncbi:glutamate cyclase domain-containing protein [Microbulbifer sp. SA54]|uniref:glutamate cyclase domain-containing protein n=1 Tax=Microbulbifer sp. SA54 TaxID=3401577 RepID=UPI003AAAB7EC